jgi:hypothetical protein
MANTAMAVAATIKTQAEVSARARYPVMKKFRGAFLESSMTTSEN